MASSSKKLVLYPLLLQLVSMFRAAPNTFGLEQVPRSLYFIRSLGAHWAPMTNPLHQLIEPWFFFQKRFLWLSQFFFPQEQKYEPDSVPRPPEWTDQNSLQQVVVKPFLSKVNYLCFLMADSLNHIVSCCIVTSFDASILESWVPSFPALCADEVIPWFY